MTRKHLGAVFLLFASSFVYSQTVITGSVVTIKDQPISFANIVLTNYADSSSIISYAISNEKGEYSLRFQSNLDSLLLSISYIGYKTIHQTIPNTNQQLDFTLEESVDELEAILIKGSKGISQNGDTLSYFVDVFKTVTDQSIADVLERLPGIEIQSNGQILYQGKPIQKYYIEGLDLLEGKYSLANNNLPANAVEEVQVLENHQPISVLDGFSQSDETSINIKLKSNVALTGQAKVGSGFAPALFDINIAPLLFTKKNQLIALYQANNTGNNVEQQLEVLTISDVQTLRDGYVKNSDWLSIPKIEPYQLQRPLWLDNNIHMVTPNYLLKVKNGFQLKTTLAFVSDSQNQIGETNTNFFTGSDTISIVEQTKNKLKHQLLQGGFTFEKNTTKKFLKNKIEFSKKWSEQEGIITGTNNVDQRLANPYNRVTNQLDIITSLNKKLLRLNSFTAYSNTPNRLVIYPGQFEDFINSGNPYESINQKTNVDLLYTNNSLNFGLKLGELRLNLRTGLNYKNEKLNSTVETSVDTGIDLDNGFKNDLSYQTTKIYSEIGTQYVKKSLKIDATVNLGWQNLSIKDPFHDLNLSPNYTIIEPRVRLTNNFSSKLDGGVGYNFKNDFAKLSNIYNGLVLLDYRTFQRNTNELPRSLNNNFTSFIKYKDTPQFFFANAYYTYSISHNNLLRKTNISESGIRSVEYLSTPNDKVSHNVSFNTSKYISRYRTTLSYKFQYSNQKSDELINNEQGVYSSIANMHNFKIKANVTNAIQINYTFKIDLYKNYNEQTLLSDYKSWYNSVRLLVTLAKRHVLSVNIENYYNIIAITTSEDWFLDLRYQYNFKSGITFETSWTNILNNNEYISAIIDPELSTISTYQLRPQQLLLSIKFRIKSNNEH